MRGIIVTCLSKADREEFLKSFLLTVKKSKSYEKAFNFSDDGDCMQCIELTDEVNGALSVAMVMIQDRTTIKISGVGRCRLDPIEIPEGAFVVVNARM